MPTKSGKSGHLHYVDVVRLLTVALVIAVHVLALEPLAPTLAAGALLTVTHVSREVFFLLTAFVLTYGYLGRQVRWPSFWRKRYLFVAVPYLMWTAIYFLADDPNWSAVTSAVHTLAVDVLTGTARYHLYFLLVSMQIYLVFPLLRGLLRITAGRHGWLLAASTVFQLVFFLAVQQQWSLGSLSGWVRSPDALLPSYIGFVIAGGLAAWHKDALVRWTETHLRTVFLGCAASIALGVGVFLAQVELGGQGPLQASAVFQPVVVVESVGITWAFLALGLIWQRHGRPAGRVVRAGSDASFGVYLVHPLILQGMLAFSATIGVTALARQLPGGLVIAVEMLVVVPLIYLISGLFATAARRTPVSLPLTGRARVRPAKREVPVPERVSVTPIDRPLKLIGGSR
ncbi:MAG TPA: acyltransferase [Pseudonocardiaceae bacterium]|nr:acyltransferase [Pseudonocardiaceae bacterium]